MSSLSVAGILSHLAGEALRNLPPDRDECRKMVRRLVRKLGIDPVCGALSVERRQLAYWLQSGGIWKPRDRKLVWLVYALHFEPNKLASTFDLITCGRFLAD